MNRRQIKYLYLIGLIMLSASLEFSMPLPNHLLNKMNKSAIKLWGKEVSFTQEISIDHMNPDHHVFEASLGGSAIGYAIISRALGCKIGGCSPKNSEESNFEDFYYLTLVNRNHKIIQVKVLEYTSDHGYEIANKGWLKQFQQGNYFKVGQNIDAISGATISVNSITQGVNSQLEIINQLP